MEIARLEEEFRRLTEENRTLVTVHNERAQQLERLCLTNQTRQDSSWPLTSAEPETFQTSSWHQARKPTRNEGSARAHSTQTTASESANYTEKRRVYSCLSHLFEPQTCCHHQCEVVIVILPGYDTRSPFWVLFCYYVIFQNLPGRYCNASQYIYTMSAAVNVTRYSDVCLRSCGDSDLLPEVCGGSQRWYDVVQMLHFSLSPAPALSRQVPVTIKKEMRWVFKTVSGIGGVRAIGEEQQKKKGDCPFHNKYLLPHNTVRVVHFLM